MSGPALAGAGEPINFPNLLGKFLGPPWGARGSLLEIDSIC